jgi:prepilin-type N-terminal cleavage/methylation domain-containing protein
MKSTSIRQTERSNLSSISGFTLIEVMISLFILVIIGVATSKAVIDAAKLKENLKDETEFSSEFRTSVTLIERDLNQVFNPRWFLPAGAAPLNPYEQPLQPSPGKISAQEVNNRLRGTAFQAFEYWGKVFNASGIRPSRFKGDERSMSFVTSSHIRVYREKHESIFAKVHYELEKQPENPNLSKEQNQKNADLYSLIKTENTRAFDLEEPREAPYIQYFTILNQIKSLKFRYYKVGEKNPLNSWDSENDEFKGSFPESVEVELSLRALNGRTMDATILFKLETPNEALPTTY